MIPQEIIDRILDRVDIVEVISGYISLKKSGRNFKACCPFHNEKTPSFTVSPGKGFYHCFGCGAHGTAIGFLMEYEHMSFVEAIESLANVMGVDVPRDETDRPARRYDELFSLMVSVETHWQNCLRDNAVAVDYLKKRGIDGATAKRFGIGFAPDSWSDVLDKFGKTSEAAERLLATGLVIRKDNGKHYDRFRDRIIFPIRDARGRTIAFGGRALGDGEPKYLNSPETPAFHKGRELYGLYEARQAQRKLDRILVVEGYMDVVSLANHGIQNAVGTLGTATTPEHLRRLFRASQEVVFCFDGDRAGRAAAWRALQTSLPEMRDGRQVRFLFLPDGEDPDSLVCSEGPEGLRHRMQSTVTLSDYLLEELEKQTDTNTMDGRARLAELARPLFEQLPPGIFRELLAGRLADEVGMEPNKLTDLLSDGRPDAGHSRRQRAPYRQTSGRSTVVRRAIQLILNYPAIGVMVTPPENLAHVRQRGTPLLLELLEITRERPDINSAGLLEPHGKRHNLCESTILIVFSGN